MTTSSKNSDNKHYFFNSDFQRKYLREKEKRFKNTYSVCKQRTEFHDRSSHRTKNQPLLIKWICRLSKRTENRNLKKYIELNKEEKRWRRKKKMKKKKGDKKEENSGRRKRQIN